MSETVLTDPQGRNLLGTDGLPLYVEADLTPPVGKACGALPMPEAHGQECAFWRDKFLREIIDPKDWPEWIRAGAGNHRKYVNWIYDQDGVGSCASEGLHACVDVNRERRGLSKVRFNPWPIYYYASGGSDRGSTLTACIRESRSRGMVPDILWPRQQHRWSDLPPSNVWDEARKYKPDEIYDIGNTVEAASALFLGHSVYAAYPGHAWQLIAVLNTTQALWRNSWGAGWDGDGFGVIAFSKITYQYGLFAIQTTSAES